MSVETDRGRELEDPPVPCLLRFVARQISCVILASMVFPMRNNFVIFVFFVSALARARPPSSVIPLKDKSMESSVLLEIKAVASARAPKVFNRMNA